MPHSTEPTLREVLERLAASARVQESYLRVLGSWPSLDELALELDDVAQASEVWMPPEGADRVRLLDQKLDAMSGPEHAELWKADALHGTEWGEVRTLAASALAALG